MLCVEVRFGHEGNVSIEVNGLCDEGLCLMRLMLLRVE